MCGAFDVGVDRPEFESLPLYVVVSTTTSGCTTIDCIEDCTEGAELCQLGSSVMVVREGAEGLDGAFLLLLVDLSPLPEWIEVDFLGCTGDDFGDGVDNRSGCSSGRT